MPLKSIAGEERPSIGWFVLVVGLLCSVLLFGLDNTITATTQATIVRQFNSTNKLPWFSIAYLAGAAGTNPFWGQAYSQFNVKWLFIFNFLLFEVGSILCGSAPTADAFIVGRAITGLGGAGMYVGLSIIISTNAKPQQRPLYFSLIGMARATGTVLGPIIGGALAENANEWRWAFWLNPIVGAPCLLCYLVMVPGMGQPRDQKPLARLANIDWLGEILLSGALVSILMAISFGGVMYAWNSARIIALFVVSGVLWILFALQQRFSFLAKRRCFPVQFMASPTMMSLFVSTACSTASIFVPVYFIPLYYQFVHDYSPLQAGLRLLPYIAFNAATLLANGFTMGRWPYYMPWYLVGGCFSVAGAAALFTISASTSNAKIYGYSILLGIGGGAYSQLAFSVIQSKIDKSLVAMGMAFCAFGQLVGPAFALSISNAIFLNLATSGIQSLSPGTPRSVIQEVVSGASQSQSIPGVSQTVQQEAINVVVSALDNVFLLPLSAGALTILLAAFMQRERLFSEVETSKKTVSGAQSSLDNEKNAGAKDEAAASPD